MQSSWTFLAGQLLTQAPMLLVYIVGIVLATFWMRRAPLAAMLTLVGCAIMLGTSVLMMFLQNYLFNSRGGQTAMSIGQMMQWSGLASSILRAIGLGMVVAGVFANRPPVIPHAGFEVRSQ